MTACNVCVCYRRSGGKAAPPKMLKFECDDWTHLITNGLNADGAGLTAGRLLIPCARLRIL